MVVPVAIQLARDLLKQEKIMLPGNIHLYDLLGQIRGAVGFNITTDKNYRLQLRISFSKSADAAALFC